MHDNREQILNSFTVASPVFPNDSMAVVRVRRNDTAQHALEVLIKNGLSSVPIVDPDHHSEPIALFTVAHVVAFVVKHIDPHGVGAPRERDWDAWILTHEKFVHQTAYAFVHYCTEHYHVRPAVAVPSTLTLRQACKLLLEKHAHEIMVFDKDRENRLENVVAASRLVEFLAAGLDSLPIAKQPVGDFEGGLAVSKNVVAVLDDAKALSAFEQMIEKKTSCCAVVDGQQKVVGCVSLNDIKALGTDFQSLRLLDGTVTDFLAAVSKSRPHGPGRTPRPKAVTCSAHDPLRDVLALFSFYKVHHVFIVDKDDKASGVISVIDVIRWVMHQMKPLKSDESNEDD